MKKDIYIIRNTVNDKVYIGQSVDYLYRFRKHRETAARNNFKYKSYLYNAMNEIGIDKFYVELLESQIEDYNEKEIYYIQKFNSLRPNGYNLAKGGDWYPNLSGIEHHSAKITTIEELEAIYDELLYTDYNLTEIAQHFNVNFSVIQKINSGETYNNPEFTYPLKECVLSKQALERLTYDLKYSNLSYADIGKAYGISTNQVKAINSGRSWHREHLTYPIRKMVFNGTDNDIENIQKDLLSTSSSFPELATKYKCSVTTIKRINSGETHHNDQLQYPLRKTKEKITTDDLIVIYDLLKNTSKSFYEIGEMYGVSDATIKRINNGTTKKYRNEKNNYPIRQI